jgi:CheY-like chemotaxis protein
VQLAPLPVGLPHRGITDNSWFQENLFCIVNNAVKYSKAAPGGVLVTVAYDTSTSTLEINVRNAASVVLTGAQLERLFEAPVLVDPTNRARWQVGGMGLGMYCLAERVRALDGECGARTVSDETSSTEVWFKIPFPPVEDTEFVTTASEDAASRHNHELSRSSSSDNSEDPEDRLDSPPPIRSPAPISSPVQHVRNTQSVKWSEEVRDASYSSNFQSPRMSAEQGLLPTTSSKLARTKKTDSSSGKKPLSDVRALVVDDSIPILKVVTMTMISNGATVTTAADGADAVQKFQDSRFDLVVTDIQMPVLGVRIHTSNALDLCSLIKF